MRPKIIKIGVVKPLENGRWLISGWYFDSKDCDESYTIQDLFNIYICKLLGI